MDIEKILSPIVDPDPSSRLKLRRDHSGLFKAEETYENYVLYGPEQPDLPAPDPPVWSTFVRDAESYLSTKCKDLWVAAWWLEALIKVGGFESLSGGLEAVYRICTEQWDDVYPDPNEEDGLEYTLKMLGGFSLGDHFETCLLSIPITPEVGAEGPATFGTIEQLDASVRASLTGEATDDFVLSMSAHLGECVDTWKKLDSYFDERFPGHQVPFAKVSEMLKSCQGTMANTYPSIIQQASQSEEPDESGEQEGEVTGVIAQNAPAALAGLNGAGDHVANREQAFRTLEMLSDYFSKNEPNSPVSHAILQAVRWGRMPFEELMAEIVDDDDARAAVLRLAGIKEPEDDD